MIITEKLKDAATKDPFAYGMTYITLPSNTKWEYRPWLPAIYNSINPYNIQNGTDRCRKTTIIKSTQSGLTTAGLVKAMHMMTEFGLNVGYSLPRDQDVIDLGRAKLNPIIDNSPYIQSKLGNVDASKMKQIGNSFMYLMFMTTEPRMVSADCVMNDEVDLSNPDHVATMQNRMDDSDWKLTLNYSTPTLKGYGIDALYAKSCQYEWMIKCPHCGKYQILDWKKNIRVTGMKLNPTSVDYICWKCQGVLTTQDFLGGEWVAQVPDLINFHTGFHISQMMFYDPMELYLHSVDPNSTIQEFYRKRLGMPYSSGNTDINYDWLVDNAVWKEADIEEGRLYIGVDQANTISVVIILVKNDAIQVIMAEEFEEEGFEQLRRLLKKERFSGGILDADPNRNTATQISKESKGIIKLADYHDRIKGLFKVSKDVEKNVEHITIRRSQAFDHMMKRFADGEIFVSSEDGVIPQWARLLFTHIGNLRRDVEEKTTPLGVDQKVTWRHVGPDHLAHALLYALIASEEGGKNQVKVKIIGKEKKKLNNRARRSVRIR
ncbi:MAG TPA: hypothetical protein ENG48_11115 [Candidatus Atribacteria bacterium]|nr:hypothetical protein [Candidatus Atribacteria bacterium]